MKLYDGTKLVEIELWSSNPDGTRYEFSADFFTDGNGKNLESTTGEIILGVDDVDYAISMANDFANRSGDYSDLDADPELNVIITELDPSSIEVEE